MRGRRVSPSKVEFTQDTTSFSSHASRQTTGSKYQEYGIAVSCERNRLGKRISRFNFWLIVTSIFVLFFGLLTRGDADVSSDERTAVVLVSEFFAEMTERLFGVAVSGGVNMLVWIEERIILEGRPKFVSVVVGFLRVERSIRAHHVDGEVPVGP